MTEPYLLPDGVSFPVDVAWPFSLRDGDLELRPLRGADADRLDYLAAANYLWMRPQDPTQPGIAASDGTASGSTAPTGVEPERIPPVRSWRTTIRELNRVAKTGRALAWGIVVDAPWAHDPGEIIGQVTVNHIVYGSLRHASIIYWIDEHHAGQGIVTRAVGLVADYCFGVMGLHRLEAVIRPENQRAVRVMHKLGFRDEGVRPGYIHLDGQWRDVRVFALNRDEALNGLTKRLREDDNSEG